MPKVVGVLKTPVVLNAVPMVELVQMEELADEVVLVLTAPLVEVV
jgi:hypothetical protein